MANIAVIVPVFNEETVLEKSVLSLLAQTYPATELILVDDGSTDRSVEIANELAQRFPSVHNIQTTAHAVHEPGKKVVYAFQRGFDALRQSWDVVCKFDADIVFPETYLAQLSHAFETNKALGMFGGVLIVKHKGTWTKEGISSSEHVRGPIKAYSKACFSAIGGLRPALGWDTLDELLALYHGFEVVTDQTLEAKHLRPTGQEYSHNLAKAKGRVFYQLGYGLLLGLLACVKWSITQGGNFIGVLSGFLQQWVLQKEKLVTKEQAVFIRKYRWSRIFGRFVS